MPSYHPQAIEPRWQRYWEENKTFATPDVSPKPKFYVLDMFPYPSGAGLHVGHPEGYTATDILARYRRMRGYNVMHPMGWDAFGLPAEQYAIETGTHPRETTLKNIDTFRRQIKMLGFSYDWDREVSTTDPEYFKWTQWIFLVLFDTWYDDQARRGRPMSELPIPADVQSRGDAAVRAYRDGKRLAYLAEVPVNWCPALGTVLANEEVVDGKSERGGHPVVRMPLKQWMLRITAYADRLLEDLELLEWSHSLKEMQRNWIGRSEGAEVSFGLARTDAAPDTARGRSSAAQSLAESGGEIIRVFTTRPDTLFGATYVVLAPEHPLVERITTGQQRQAVQAYQQAAASKSDMERTELAKKKTGVFTGAYAINPVNDERIPIWIADYVLASYGTGAIMAVPAHDERDFEFAQEHRLAIRPVVKPPKEWLLATKVAEVVTRLNQQLDPSFELGPQQAPTPAGVTASPRIVSILTRVNRIWQQVRGQPVEAVVEKLYLASPDTFDEAYVGDGVAINSGQFTGLSTEEFKKAITAWLEERGLGVRKINYKLRDWLFSRQRYWGEPFPILHEVDDAGKPTGVMEPLTLEELPLELPELADYKPSGKPEPPLGKAADWVNVTRNGKKYLRETNTMPQWAGSCWYYLRYLDPRNQAAFCDPVKERYWAPVDLYVGGAEHAVLHLLYARFWHKVLFDRGHVSRPEPFMKLVNQGMILGEMEFTAFRSTQPGSDGASSFVSADQVDVATARDKLTNDLYERVRLAEDQVEKRGEGFVLKDRPEIKVDARAYKMSKSRGNVINPDKVVGEYGADSMRLYEMFMGPLEATKPWSMRGVEGVFRFLNRVWRLIVDERAETMTLSDAVQDAQPDKETLRRLHQTIKKVTEDLDGMRFNTAIAAMMEYSNHLTRLSVRPRSALEPFVLILAPFAPHLAEELWRALGHDQSLAYVEWPGYDDALTRSDEIEVPVQVNGKLRSKVVVAADASNDDLQAAALADERVQELLKGKRLKKAIVVPKKLVNLVIG